MATGSRVCRDRFQGWTGAALPGADRARCVGWDEVVTGQVQLSGNVLVLDDQADLVGPLIAVHAAQHGAATVRLVTRWPMAASETMADTYLEWIMPQVNESGFMIQADHFVAALLRVLRHFVQRLPAGSHLRCPSRHDHHGHRPAIGECSRRGVARLAGVPATAIGDALAPRGTYEAVFEGHRYGREVLGCRFPARRAHGQWRHSSQGHQKSGEHDHRPSGSFTYFPPLQSPGDPGTRKGRFNGVRR